ncbi:MAG: nodulation protein NfeD [Calditrichia bacterium]|nr:nodulation protein NfeD [Calditrichia bacterium]
MKNKILIWLFILAASILAQTKIIHKITINGIINPIATEYILESIEKAEEAGAELLIIEMDTPGGLMVSMHDIVKGILGADVPVAVYVSPSGSRAGSAGVFITIAAHIAAMAPGTNIGSAHPVSMGGTQDTSKVMEEKIVNDAVAHIRSVAEKRERNADWAESAIRESANITEKEALKLNVVDYIVPTVDSLLIAVHGRKVEVLSGYRVLDTENARIESYEMNWRQRALDILSDPNILYILFLIGITGISLELYNPGSILPGVVGGICIILFLYSVQTIPINIAGLLLILFSAILFLLEIKIPSYGILTIGGVISLVLGSLMLVDSPLPFLQISWKVILGATITMTLFFIIAISFVIRAHRKKPSTGKEGLVGEEGVTIDDLNPTGQIEVHGEIWKAVSDRRIKKGQRVIVEEVHSQHLRLKVKTVK